MPMTQEARQFHHILDVVENTEIEVLRKRVKHMPLYIAANNFERERASKTRIPMTYKGAGANNSGQGISQVTNIYSNEQNDNNTNYCSFPQHPPHEQSHNQAVSYATNRNRSTSTNDCFRNYYELHTNSDNIPIHNLNSDESLNDSNALLSNTSSRIYDELDNYDDYNAIGSSGSYIQKRKYGPRKSPNSRLAHNINEKNRRADLRESLERLKLSLPYFKQKNCKSTTADILQQGYKLIKESLVQYQNLTDRRNGLFENCLQLKQTIFSKILNNSKLFMILKNNQQSNDPTNSCAISQQELLPIDECIKKNIRTFLESSENFHIDLLNNLDICKIHFPLCNYRNIEISRKNYLQSATISMSTQSYKTNFSLSKKCQFIPSSSTTSATSTRYQYLTENYTPKTAPSLITNLKQTTDTLPTSLTTTKLSLDSNDKSSTISNELKLLVDETKNYKSNKLVTNSNTTLLKKYCNNFIIKSPQSLTITNNNNNNEINEFYSSSPKNIVITNEPIQYFNDNNNTNVYYPNENLTQQSSTSSNLHPYSMVARNTTSIPLYDIIHGDDNTNDKTISTDNNNISNQFTMSIDTSVTTSEFINTSRSSCCSTNINLLNNSNNISDNDEFVDDDDNTTNYDENTQHNRSTISSSNSQIITTPTNNNLNNKSNIIYKTTNNSSDDSNSLTTTTTNSNDHTF